jgi:hypothetical protein
MHASRTPHPQTVAARRSDSIVYGQTNDLGAQLGVFKMSAAAANGAECNRIGELLFQGQAAI